MQQQESVEEETTKEETSIDQTGIFWERNIIKS